jgi:hypothetical protein
LRHLRFAVELLEFFELHVCTMAAPSASPFPRERRMKRDERYPE